LRVTDWPRNATVQSNTISPPEARELLRVVEQLALFLLGGSDRLVRVCSQALGELEELPHAHLLEGISVSDVLGQVGMLGKPAA